MLEANRIVLEGMDARRGVTLGAIGENSRIEGRVLLGEGVELIDSLVRGPVVIGDGTRIENAFIGPYTSIGERCTLVVLRDRELDRPRRLARSATSRCASTAR